MWFSFPHPLKIIGRTKGIFKKWHPPVFFVFFKHAFTKLADCIEQVSIHAGPVLEDTVFSPFLHPLALTMTPLIPFKTSVSQGCQWRLNTLRHSRTFNGEIALLYSLNRQRSYDGLEKKLKEVFSERSSILHQLSKTSKELDSIKGNLQVGCIVLRYTAVFEGSVGCDFWAGGDFLASAVSFCLNGKTMTRPIYFFNQSDVH